MTVSFEVQQLMNSISLFMTIEMVKVKARVDVFELFTVSGMVIKFGFLFVVGKYIFIYSASK